MPTTKVKSPDGRIIHVNHPEGASQSDIIAYAQANAGAGKHDPTNDMSGMETTLAGFGKGMTDLAYGAGQAVGLVDQETIAERERIDAPLMDTTGGKVGNVLGKVAAAIPSMFIPGVNTAVGATTVGAGLGLLEPVAEGSVLGGKVKNTAIGAAGGRVGHTVGNYLGSKLTQYTAKVAARKAAEKSANAAKDATLNAAKDLGYKVNPTQSNPTILNKTLEGLAGKISTAQRAAEQNQAITNLAVKRSIGLADDAPLTMESIGAVRAEAGKVYDAVQQIASPIKADKGYIVALRKAAEQNRALAKDFPVLASGKIDELVNGMARREFAPSSAIEALKTLRRNAQTSIAASPADKAYAQANRRAAEALEGLIERNLSKMGKPELFNQWKAARQLYAKTYTAEKALNPGTGNVVSAKLAKALRDKVPLTGDVKTAAEFASGYPKATQEVLSSMTAINPMDAGVATMAAVVRQDPSLLGMMLGRPAVRGALLSKPYQSLMTSPKYNSGATRALLGATGNQLPRYAPLLGAEGSIYSAQ
ncbi:hypothetical protein [Porticoccus sp.]